MENLKCVTEDFLTDEEMERPKKGRSERPPHQGKGISLGRGRRTGGISGMVKMHGIFCRNRSGNVERRAPVAVDLDGNAAAAGQCEYDIQKPELDRAEQDMDQLWEATVQAIRKMFAEKPEIRDAVRGIGFSGQMHGLVDGGPGDPACGQRHYLGGSKKRGTDPPYL